MNGQIRKLAVLVLVAFLMLFAAPLYWQVIAAPGLVDDPRNVRTLIEEYSIRRGQIVVGREAVARSVETKDQLKYQRRYDPSYAFVTGYYSHVFGASLVERQFDDYLLGKAPEQFAQSLEELITGQEEPGGNVVLTLDPAAQQAAEAALGSRKGAVVALDYRTGAVLAMTSYPRYDPNQVSRHDTERAQAAWDRYRKSEDKPLLNRATQELYPPGSTFKVITAAAALASGMEPDSPLDNSNPLVYDVPLTRADIRNFGRGSCYGGKNPVTLAESLEVSCNTTFARLGVELGAERLVEMAERFGLNGELGYQLEGAAATSRIPQPGEMDAPALAQSAIGQRDVRVSPLQMAVVAATIANGGERMAPYVVSRVTDERFRDIRRFEPRSQGQAVPPEVAADLQAMMARVVSQGTAEAAQVPGVQVHGKTGTAQHAEGQPPHAWFIGFASSGERAIAVAVVVENGGDLGSEATGGRVAAPIAKAVIEAYLRGAR